MGIHTAERSRNCPVWFLMCFKLFTENGVSCGLYTGERSRSCPVCFEMFFKFVLK